MSSERPVLVLLHAFPLSSVLYADVSDALAEVVDLVLPEFRGFGGTEPPDVTPSLDVYADDVVAVLDRLGVDRAIIGGTSMGGYVAMALGRRHPTRVGGLLLIDTKSGGDPDAAAANRERIASTVLAEDSVRVVLDDVFPALLGSTSVAGRPDVVARVRGWVAGANPEGVAWAQRAMAVRPDSLETLRGMGVPALVVVGAEDRLVSEADAELMAGALPQGRLVVLPGAGHLSPIEVPDAFSAAVRGWLRDVLG